MTRAMIRRSIVTAMDEHDILADVLRPDFVPLNKRTDDELLALYKKLRTGG